MQAIILKKSPFSEGNEIITMYSRELGKVRGVARAVKFAKSKLAFGLQALFYSEVELLKTKNNFTIIGVKVLDPFSALRENLENLKYALYATEIILKSTADEQPNEQIFDYYLQLLKHLCDKSSVKHPCTDWFALKIMELSGYGLNFEKCAICSKGLNAEKQIYFSNRKFGFVCSADYPKVSDARAVSQKTHQFLCGCESNSFEIMDLVDVDQKELHSISNSFLNHILERDLKSARFLV